MNDLKSWAAEIATEISSRSHYDIDEITSLILVRTKEAAELIVGDYQTSLEKRYRDLVKQSRKHKIGSRKYGEIGLQINEVKYKMKIANRAIHESEKNEVYTKLKDFIRDRLGSDALAEFYESLTSEEPIYSTSKNKL